MYFETNHFLDTSDKVQYNYYPTIFYKNQFQDTIAKSGFIKIPYSSKQNQPNIAIFGSGYVSKALYITAPIHKIKGTDYDAELIIEHIPLTNFTDRLYTCFLLKTSKCVINNIDNLISGSSDVVLGLNRYIVKQKAIVYKNNYLDSSTVIVFTIPIYVNTTFANLKPSLLSLAPYVNEYSVLHTDSIMSSSLGNVREGIEGANDDDGVADGSESNDELFDGLTNGLSGKLATTDVSVAASNPAAAVPVVVPAVDTPGGKPVTMAGYCQPIDESDPTIGETSGVIIPMDSSKMKNEAANSTIKTMLNFFGFFVLIISAVFITPIAHKIMIIELIMDNETFSAQRKLNRANAADVYTGILFFGFAIAFINYGILNNAPFATVIGFYVFIFFMASVIVLQYQRIFDPATYLKQFTTKGVIPSFDNVEMDWGFFSDNVFNLFFTSTMVKNEDPKTASKTPMVAKYNFQFGFIGVLFLYTGFYSLLKMFEFTGVGGSFFLTSIYTYGIFFSIYIMALVGHYKYKSSQIV